MCTCVLYEVYYSRKYISKGKVERRKICFKVLRVFYTRRYTNCIVADNFGKYTYDRKKIFLKSLNRTL